MDVPNVDNAGAIIDPVVTLVKLDFARVVSGLLFLQCLNALHLAIVSDELFQVRRRTVARDIHEKVFAFRRCDARHRADLRITDRADPKRVTDFRQRSQSLRNSHLLPRRADRGAGAGVIVCLLAEERKPARRSPGLCI